MNVMILIIGGLGFVGANTARALLDIGEDCVLTQHRNTHVPAFLRDHVGKRIFIEPLDILNSDALRRLGRKYTFTGIIHLASGGLPAGPEASAFELVKDVQDTLTTIAAVVQAAHEWNVKRVTIASAPVVYNGIGELPWRDDQLLPMTAAFSMEVTKKCGEIVSSYLSLHMQIECVEMRLAAMYGPNYDPTRSSLVGRLVHAAARGAQPNLEGMHFGSIYADDGGDQCYIKDAARGIALLQTADKISQPVYNISSGYPTSNQAIVDAVRQVVPEFEVELPPGHMPGAPEDLWYFDIAKLQEDTGYIPQFTIETGVADYIDWLRAGNSR
jgi:UDP-glucose 4-epimerase